VSIDLQHAALADWPGSWASFKERFALASFVAMPLLLPVLQRSMGHILAAPIGFF